MGWDGVKLAKDGVCQLLLDSSNSKLEGVRWVRHTQTVYANRYISNCWDFITPVTVVWGKLAAIKQTVDFNHDTNMHSVCF